MSRSIGVVLLLAIIGVVPASAQEQRALPSPLNFATAAPTLLSDGVSSPAAEPVAPSVSLAQPLRVMDRPTTSVNVLCVSFAALQVLDLHATFTALDRGAREANPLLGGFSSNKAAMVGFKAASTAGTIYLVRKFGVKNRAASIILMAAANSAYAIIAAHNYRVASALK